MRLGFAWQSAADFATILSSLSRGGSEGPKGTYGESNLCEIARELTLLKSTAACSQQDNNVFRVANLQSHCHPRTACVSAPHYDLSKSIRCPIGPAMACCKLPLARCCQTRRLAYYLSSVIELNWRHRAMAAAAAARAVDGDD